MVARDCIIYALAFNICPAVIKTNTVTKNNLTFNQLNSIINNVDKLEKLEFWDLMRKIITQIDEIDAGIIIGIYKGHSYTQTAETLNVTRKTIFNRRNKIKQLIGNIEKPLPKTQGERDLLLYKSNKLRGESQ